MNRTILQKCITELEKETPKLDYVRGMLETLIETLPAPALVSSGVGANAALGSATNLPQPVQTDTPDERAIMDAKARAAVAEIKKITEASTDA